MEDIIKKLQRPLRIDQIDFRVQSITAKGFATILAYKDARTDMNRLDEVCGAWWQDKYELIDGQLFCSIGIKIGDEWIWRQDVGIESNTEKEKGRASDAFKRAGFRWGIGRELYDFPRIQMTLKPEEFTTRKNGQREIGVATFKLKLNKWKWDITRNEGVIRLTAHDENGDLRYDSARDFNGAPSGGSQSTRQPATQPPKQQTTAAKGASEKPWLNKMAGKDFTREWLNVLKAFNAGKISSVNQIKEHYRLSKETEAELQQILNY